MEYDFSVGQQVYLPWRGVGTVHDLRMPHGGDEGMCSILLLDGGLYAIPFLQLAPRGVRPLIPAQAVDVVYAALRDRTTAFPEPAPHMHLINTGDPLILAGMLRRFSWERTVRPLTQDEEDFYGLALGLLAAELAAVQGNDVGGVRDEIARSLLAPWGGQP